MKEMRIVVLDASQRRKHSKLAVYLDLALDTTYLEQA